MYAGLFAYVADGRNGLKVVELSSPQSVPGNQGSSPAPAPKLIAWYPTKGTAMQVSEGYRRDRGVDESGNQIAIFGRRGARPFDFEELRRMYLIDGRLFTVTDEPVWKEAESSRHEMIRLSVFVEPRNSSSRPRGLLAGWQGERYVAVVGDGGLHGGFQLRSATTQHRRKFGRGHL